MANILAKSCKIYGGHTGIRRSSLLDIYHRGKGVEGRQVGISKRTIGSPLSIEDSTEMKEYCVVENRFALREWWKRIRMEASFCDHVRGKVLGHCVMELGT